MCKISGVALRHAKYNHLMSCTIESLSVKLSAKTYLLMNNFNCIIGTVKIVVVFCANEVHVSVKMCAVTYGCT